MKKWSILLLVFLLAFSCIGSLAEETSFKTITAFSEGLAAVQSADGLWGYIDKTGKMVIPCKWKDAKPFSCGVACVRDTNGLWGFIDASGTEVIPCERTYSSPEAKEGMICVYDDAPLNRRKMGILTVSGEVVSPCQWESVNSIQYSEGLAYVCKDDLYGYIDTKGELVIPCQFITASSFHHGFALVQTEDGFFFIDRTGAPAFPDLPIADSGADSFRDDEIATLQYKDRPDIFINKAGQIVLELPEYLKEVSNFTNGRAGVIDKRKEVRPYCGYINLLGEIVIPCELYNASRFTNGRSCIPDSPASSSATNCHYGIIDTDGKLVYPYSLDNYVAFHDTVVSACQNGLAGAIDMDGKVIVPFEYEKVEVGDGVVLCLKEGVLFLFDYNGNLLG